jgi:beta-N-acetylhexosaminidase
MTRLLGLLAAVLLSVTACATADEPTGETVPPNPAAPEETTVTPTPEAPPALAWGPTQERYDEAHALVSDLTVDEQAGQVIMAHYSGTVAPVALVERLNLGGVIVMGENVDSPEQVEMMISDLHESVERSAPLLIAVDQEGGRVARVRQPATEFPSLMTLGAAGDQALAADVARASGRELRAMGFTMVFAPDADVTVGPSDPTVGTRSASSDPELAARIVTGAIRGYTDAGILAVAKHFPGHGSVSADSHVELPTQDASLAELVERDFVPFVAAIDAGVPAVMVAHLDVRDVDPGVPSSVSPAVVALLRDYLGFDGLLVTDAQDMQGLAGEFGAAEAAVRALEAGVDLVLMPADPAAAHAGIVTAVESGRLDRDRLAEAATRVTALALHQADAGPAEAIGVVGSHDDVVYAASLAGLTVVGGPCEGRLVGDSIQVIGGDDTDQARMIEAAEAAGLRVGSGDVVRLLGALPPNPGSGDVVVSLDTPYALAESDASTAKIALYNRTPGGFRALVDVLTGEARGGGRLPVEVDGVERDGCS